MKTMDISWKKEQCFCAIAQWLIDYKGVVYNEWVN